MTAVVSAPRQTGASLQFIADTARRTNYFGPDEVQRTFGMSVKAPRVPVHFSEKVITRALSMNCCVVVQHGQNVDGKPLTLKHLHDSRENKDALNGTLLYNTDWYQSEPFFTTEAPRPGLFLKGRDVIPDSTGKTFIQESLAAVKFVEALFEDELPMQYTAAIAELRERAQALEKLCYSDWKEGARRCVALAFSRLFRESPVEVLYRILLAQTVNRERLFAKVYTRTNRLSGGGDVVPVGLADSHGAFVSRWEPVSAHSYIGFSFSCSGELSAGS